MRAIRHHQLRILLECRRWVGRPKKPKFRHSISFRLMQLDMKQLVQSKLRVESKTHNHAGDVPLRSVVSTAM